MFMPIMDHRIVANMKPGESAWIVDRAFSVLSNTYDLEKQWNDVSLNGQAHLYDIRSTGANTWVYRRDSHQYYVKYYRPDRTGYIPFFVSVDQVTGATPVNIEMEDKVG